MTVDVDPKIEKILDILRYLTDQLIGGYAALQAYKHLDTAYRRSGFGRNGFFFTTTYLSCRDVALLTLARLALPHRDSITIYYLLNSAMDNSSGFPFASQQDVVNTVKSDRRRLSQLKPLLIQVKKQRDQRLAHLDRKFINDPASVLSDEPIIANELEEAYMTLLQLINTYKHFAEDSELYIGNLAMDIERDVDYIFDRLSPTRPSRST